MQAVPLLRRRLVGGAEEHGWDAEAGSSSSAAEQHDPVGEGVAGGQHQGAAGSSASSGGSDKPAPPAAAAKHPLGSEGMGYSYQAFCIAHAGLAPPVPFGAPPEQQQEQPSHPA